jgi:hemerythrin
MTRVNHIDLPQLPVAFMNDDHAHAAEQWEAMLAALDHNPADVESLLTASEEFLRHNREHFQREEAAMRASGFPPYTVHKQEHDRVLAWLEGLVASIRAGEDSTALRRVIRHDIGDWLLRHVQTMDQVTARWIDAHPD